MGKDPWGIFRQTVFFWKTLLILEYDFWGDIQTFLSKINSFQTRKSYFRLLVWKLPNVLGSPSGIFGRKIYFWKKLSFSLNCFFEWYTIISEHMKAVFEQEDLMSACLCKSSPLCDVPLLRSNSRHFCKDFCIVD